MFNSLSSPPSVWLHSLAIVKKREGSGGGGNNGRFVLEIRNSNIVGLIRRVQRWVFVQDVVMTR